MIVLTVFYTEADWGHSVCDILIVLEIYNGSDLLCLCYTSMNV